MREWKILRFGSYEALVADPGIDACLRAAPGITCMSSGRSRRPGRKHVLCEKPLALDAAGVDRIAEAARSQGGDRRGRSCHRHQAQTDRVLSLVAEGAIGRLRFVRGSFCSAHAKGTCA
jgi:predicted dehydrogenase